MRITSRFLGGLLAVVAASGCATTATKSIPVRPLADGKAVPAAEYDLRVGAQPGGRVVLLAGHTMRESPHRQVVHVGLLIDNHSEREYRLPANQLLLASAEAQKVPLIEVDDNPPPALLTVAPGESRTFDLKFLLPDQPGIGNSKLFQVHWTLDVDGGHAPVVRTTAFMLTPHKAPAERPLLKTQVQAVPPLRRGAFPQTGTSGPTQHRVSQAARTMNFQ